MIQYRLIHINLDIKSWSLNFNYLFLESKLFNKIKDTEEGVIEHFQYVHNIKLYYF